MRSPLLAPRLLAFILLMVPLAGCTLGAAKPAAVPPAPKPVVAPPPAPEPQLSVPQTAITLPSAQPLNPAAIPEPQVASATPAEKPEAPPAPRPARRPAAGPPKPAETDTEPDPPPTPVVTEQAPIQPILGAEELKRIHASIEARRKEITEKLSHVKGKQNQILVDRIQSFLSQSAEAEKRGDFSQADALSERAVILAREIQGE